MNMVGISAGRNGTLRSWKHRSWPFKIMYTYIWRTELQAGELGYPRESSFRVSLVPDGAVSVSSERRQRKGATGDALQLGAGAAPSTISSGGTRGGQPTSSSPLSTFPGLLCPSPEVITCHTASRDCQQHWGQLGSVHPFSLGNTTQPPRFAALATCPVFCSHGGSHTPPPNPSNTQMKEPQNLIEYFGSWLVRWEGTSDTGNTHPIGSEWLHTAPLPSARK